MTTSQSSSSTHASTPKPLSKNPHLLAWVDEMAKLTKPDRIVWIDDGRLARISTPAEANIHISEVH